MTRRLAAAPMSLLGLIAGLSLLPGCSSEGPSGPGTDVIKGSPEVFPGNDPGSSRSQSQTRSQSRT